MITYRTTAIGSRREIDFISSSIPSSHIMGLFDELFNKFEKQYSRFFEDSLVSRLNFYKIIETTDKHLIKMIQIGIEYQQRTSGYFSLFVGSALENLGYGGNQIHKKNINVKGDGNIPLGKIMLQTDNILITKEASGLYHIALLTDNHIDLGGVGKGYLIHLIEEILIDNNIVIYRINGGGDIFIKQPTVDIFGSILLQNPLDEKQTIGETSILQGACCGSGPFYRKRKINDDRLVHHLIDPYTQKSVQSPLVGVFTTHSNVIIADIAATTLFVAPLEKVELLAENMGVEYMLIFDDLSIVRTSRFQIE